MGTQVLILPGYANSAAGHWQTLWERAHPEFARVQQADWHDCEREEWVGALDAAITAHAGKRVFVVAHSLGCATVAHWARLGRAPLAGALLVAPPDLDARPANPMVRGFAPLPLDPLPFPSIVVASTDDPYATIARSGEIARRWGSRFVDIGAAAHIGDGSGVGDWPAGMRLLEQLMAQRQLQ